jgi:hypothetical protein
LKRIAKDVSAISKVFPKAANRQMNTFSKFNEKSSKVKVIEEDG